jgi:hypothetical protein
VRRSDPWGHTTVIEKDLPPAIPCPARGERVSIGREEYPWLADNDGRRDRPLQLAPEDWPRTLDC